MNRQRPSLNPAFREYARLLLELHRLIRSGQGDEQPADEIRDEMDGIWRRLNSDEIDKLRGLSADLNSLAKPLIALSKTPVTETPDFEDAAGRGDWFAALGILRQHADGIPPTDIAFLRGVCWAHLQAPDVAIEFLAWAREHAPEATDRLVWLLTCYVVANRVDEAIGIATQIEAGETDPELMLKAAEVFSMRTLELSPPESAAMRERAIALAEKGLKELDSRNSDDQFSRVMRVSALLHLALDFEASGEKGKALRACDEALRLDPENLNAVMLRGWINRLAQPDTAQSDFLQGFTRRLALGADLVSIPAFHEST